MNEISDIAVQSKKSTPSARVVRAQMKVHMVAVLPRTGRIFVKTNSFRGEDFDEDRLREHAAHQLLQGLAIAPMLDLTRSEIRILLGYFAHRVVTTEYVGESLDKAQLTTSESIGAWAHICEQLVAFRRLGLLYSDIKPPNIAMDKTKNRVTILDLEGVAILQRSNRYELRVLKTTPFFGAPEHLKFLKARREPKPAGVAYKKARKLDRPLTEAALIHQLGMTLMHTLGQSVMNLSKGRKKPPKKLSWLETRKLVHQHLNNEGLQPLVHLTQAMIRSNPAMRPKNYEVVLSQITNILSQPTGTKARQMWAKLRMPYLEKLNELKLPGPTPMQAIMTKQRQRGSTNDT